MKDKLNPEQQKKLEELKKKIETRHARAFINSVLARKKPGQILLILKDRLSLTDEQLAKVRPIIEENFERLDKIVMKYREKDHPEIFSLRSEVRKLRKTTEKDLATILTTEQLEEYQKILKEEWLERRREMRKRK